MISRRRFIKAGVAGAAALSMAPATTLAETTHVDEVEAQSKPNKFHLGMAGFTFVNFSLQKTLETMKRLDVHYLCIKNFHLPFEATDAEIKAFHDLCAQYDVQGYAVGPIYMKSKEEIDNGFEYAKRVGVKLIVGVPEYELLPYVSEKVKEYDFHYAIHLHGPDIKTYPDATDAWEHVKDLDPRLGICLDVGHDFRNGCDPVADYKRYRSRIFDMHFKDETEATAKGWCTEIGRGKVDFPGLIKAMRKYGYDGKCSLEFEKDMKDPFMGIAESIGYLKALMR